MRWLELWRNKILGVQISLQVPWITLSWSWRLDGTNLGLTFQNVKMSWLMSAMVKLSFLVPTPFVDTRNWLIELGLSYGHDSIWGWFWFDWGSFRFDQRRIIFISVLTVFSSIANQGEPPLILTCSWLI